MCPFANLFDHMFEVCCIKGELFVPRQYLRFSLGFLHPIERPASAIHEKAKRRTISLIFGVFIGFDLFERVSISR